MRISDWSSDVCSSDLPGQRRRRRGAGPDHSIHWPGPTQGDGLAARCRFPVTGRRTSAGLRSGCLRATAHDARCRPDRSEEHTSELQSLMRISYAVFCLKKKKKIRKVHTYTDQVQKIVDIHI